MQPEWTPRAHLYAPALTGALLASKLGAVGPVETTDLPAPGSVLAGKYEVERILGAGGMGVVLAARHLHLGQRVAIKFMRSEAAHDTAAVERFLREARAAVSLSSEHVARVLDVGMLENGAPYMVMEYLAGVDLSQVLRRDGPLPVKSAVDMLIQACDAIAEAHARGIVHRDLKPANLFLTQRADGSALVKVLDFGISKPARIAEQQSLTISGTVMGSPGYMSPEQVRSTKAVDARSDIWSLGVVLFELLTGVSPFQGETLGDTFAKITSEPPPAIRTLRPDIPEALATTIGRCLERPLHARLQSVAELAAGLLPFAPAEAAVVAARVARLAGNRGPSTSSETLAAPSMTAAGFESAGHSAGERLETGPAWQKSGTGAPPRQGMSILSKAAGGALLLGLVAAGVWTLTRAPAAGPPKVDERATASNVATSLAPPPAVPQVVLAPPANAHSDPPPLANGPPASDHEVLGATASPDAGRPSTGHAPPVNVPHHAPKVPAPPPPPPSPSSTAQPRHDTDLL